MQAEKTADPGVEVDTAAAYLEPASLLQDGARTGLLIHGRDERKRGPRPGPWCYPGNPGSWCCPENPQDQLALASRFQPAAGEDPGWDRRRHTAVRVHTEADLVLIHKDRQHVRNDRLAMDGHKLF
jgi:hypothetical protein